MWRGTVPALRVGCVGGGWRGGLMSSHERWKSPAVFFLVLHRVAINFFGTLLFTTKPREFVMDHPTYGNTLGSTAPQPMSGPDLLFPCPLLTPNFPSAHPNPTNHEGSRASYRAPYKTNSNHESGAAITMSSCRRLCRQM